ncbi:hypothetical protein NEIG_02459 [Nematocida sp. ERTm5]|nr:hypothetical protein NEIG_02459 [Nematocida sp. ERTm5]
MKNCNEAVLEDIDLKKIEKIHNNINTQLQRESVQGLAERSLGAEGPDDVFNRDGVYAQTCLGIVSDAYKYFILPIMLYYSIMIIAGAQFIIFNGVAAGKHIDPDSRIPLKSALGEVPVLTSLFMLWSIVVYSVGTIRYMTIWRRKLFVNSCTMPKPCAIILDILFIGIIVLWGLARALIHSGYDFLIDLLIFLTMHVFQLIVGIIYKCTNSNKNNDLVFSSFTGTHPHIVFSALYCITATILCFIFILIMPQSVEAIRQSS